jgi:hypothetical protein
MHGASHLQVEQVAGEPPLQDEPRVGDGRVGFGGHGHRRLVQSPAGAVGDVQLHLAVDDRRQPRRRRADIAERLTLEGGEAVGAREVDQE